MSRKKSKVEHNDGDLISKLPESVVCHILSLLPSKDAVRTSVLSKDWESKWTCIYNIDIKDTDQFTDQRRKKTHFLNFVNRILISSGNLKSFRLECRDKYDSSRLMGFIYAAFRRNVEILELRLDRQEDIVLPRNLLNNSSLRELHLASPCTFKVPTDNCFSNLVYLYFYKVLILNQRSDSDRLVFTFPVLKTFELIQCIWSKVNLVEIYSPSLRTFSFDTPWRAKVRDLSIKICGARLEKFESYGGLPENIILYESTVLDATFENIIQVIDDMESCLQVRKLLNSFSSATDLQLTGNICKVMALSKQVHPLPQYVRLQRLVIAYFKPGMLLEFLHSAPSLKFVEIQGVCMGDFDWGEVNVPLCVISRLQEVELTKSSEKSIIPLAKFFLKNGVELKKINIDCYCYDSRKIVKKLLNFPRASTSVVIN